MTREELHALVWAQPLRTVAQGMGISDVALAKKCRKMNVPVPPRGWWAKKAAGKPVRVVGLPLAPFVQRNFFPAFDLSAPKPTDANDLIPPVFQDLEEVKRALVSGVKDFRVPRSVVNWHPLISRLLAQDEARKVDLAKTGWMSDFYGPKFVSPLQQRRLRLLSTMFIEMERLGCKISGTTKEGERFHIQAGRGSGNLRCFIDVKPMQYRNGREIVPKQEWLRFDYGVDAYDSRKADMSWQDGEKTLEASAPEIIRWIFCEMERQGRVRAISHHEWQIQHKAWQIAEARRAAEKAEAERVAAEEAAKAARVAALIEGAEALERADRIRRYVAAVRSRSTGSATEGSDDLERWASWALGQADDMDPVLSGRYTRGMDL